MLEHGHILEVYVRHAFEGVNMSIDYCNEMINDLVTGGFVMDTERAVGVLAQYSSAERQHS